MWLVNGNYSVACEAWLHVWGCIGPVWDRGSRDRDHAGAVPAFSLPAPPWPCTMALHALARNPRTNVPHQALALHPSGLLQAADGILQVLGEYGE